MNMLQIIDEERIFTEKRGNKYLKMATNMKTKINHEAWTYLLTKKIFTKVNSGQRSLREICGTKNSLRQMKTLSECKNKYMEQNSLTWNIFTKNEKRKIKNGN
jgi:hypothetical protein